VRQAVDDADGFDSGLVYVYRGMMKDINGPKLGMFEENCQ